MNIFVSPSALCARFPLLLILLCVLYCSRRQKLIEDNTVLTVKKGTEIKAKGAQHESVTVVGEKQDVKGKVALVTGAR